MCVFFFFCHKKKAMREEKWFDRTCKLCATFEIWVNRQKKTTEQEKNQKQKYREKKNLNNFLVQKLFVELFVWL